MDSDSQTYLTNFFELYGDRTFFTEEIIQKLTTEIMSCQEWLESHPDIFEDIFNSFGPDDLAREQKDVPGYLELENLLQSVCIAVRQKTPLCVFVT